MTVLAALEGDRTLVASAETVMPGAGRNTATPASSTSAQGAQPDNGNFVNRVCPAVEISSFLDGPDSVGVELNFLTASALTNAPARAARVGVGVCFSRRPNPAEYACVHVDPIWPSVGHELGVNRSAFFQHCVMP